MLNRRGFISSLAGVVAWVKSPKIKSVSPAASAIQPTCANLAGVPLGNGFRRIPVELGRFCDICESVLKDDEICVAIIAKDGSSEVSHAKCYDRRAIDRACAVLSPTPLGIEILNDPDNRKLLASFGG